MLDRILQVDSLFLVKQWYGDQHSLCGFIFQNFWQLTLEICHVKINILFVQSKPDCVNWHITYVPFLA